MILPGISGSLILLMLGMYSAVLGALTDRDLASLSLLALGAAVGLALFSQILNWGLDHHHDSDGCGPCRAHGGFDSGPLALAQWCRQRGSWKRPAEDWPAVLASALVGVAAVFLISRLAPAPVTESAPSGALQSPDGG